jgi:hypothetical protein
MKGFFILAALVVAACPLRAETWGLTAVPTECAALESLVVFGMVDGGPGGDTTEFSAVVAAGNAQRCIAWLDSYGVGDGMRLDSCRQAFDLLNANGLPDWLDGTEPEFIREVLSPQYEGACDDLLIDLTAGQ